MQHPPSSESARITEVFSSLQGEGIYIGQRHLFVRFEECHMHCHYCDELDKKGREVHLDELFSEILHLESKQGPHQYVSLTGGEPLLYLTFLRPLMLRLKQEGLKIYLETSGVLWQALREVVGWCDFISMDLKASSVTGEKNYDEDHRKFLEIAKGKPLSVKLVVSREMDDREYQNHLQLVQEIAPHVPVILMPISAEIEGHEDSVLMQRLYKMQEQAQSKGLDCRIVPRLHRILNIP